MTTVIPRNMPEDSFLARYMQAMNMLETPYIYDFFGGLWTLGAALGRNVIVPRPGAPVYMNMYLLFISESGLSRKSTSIRCAVDLLRPLFNKFQPAMTSIENKVSAEFVLSTLTEQTTKRGSGCAIVVASELAAVMSRTSRALPVLMTDLYDCPKLRQGGGSLHYGDVNIKDVFVSFIAGSTLSWLSRAVSPHVVEGGFTSRCYFVASDRRKRAVAWPDANNDKLDTGSLEEQLYNIHEQGQQRGEVGITVSARELFARWYESRQVHVDPYRRSFEGREDSHILRVAALLAVNRGAWEINDDQIQTAIKLVGYIKRTGSNFFSTEVVKSQPEKLVDRVREILLRAGPTGLLQSQVTLACNHIARKDLIVATLDVMHELAYIDKFDLTKAGKRGTMWRATSALRDRKASDTILASVVTSDRGFDVLNTEEESPTASTDQV